MQVIPAACAVNIAGIAHVPQQITLLHGVTLGYDDAAHVGVQAVIAMVVVGSAVADLYTVAVTVHGPRGADNAVGNGVNRRAARRGKVGAPVGDAPGVRFAELSRDAPIAVQRTAKG